MANTGVASSSFPQGDPKQQSAEYAKATYDRLPRELRDMVYEQLWILEDPTSDSDGIFSAPSIIDKEFAREAVEWYYKYGCLEREVALEDLKDFLFTDRFSAGLTPATSTMRSLTVLVSFTWRDCTPARITAVEAQLKPLLQLNLKEEFSVTLLLRVRLRYHVDVGCFPELGAQVKRMMQAFEEKGCKVMVQIEFSFRFVGPPSPPRDRSDPMAFMPRLVTYPLYLDPCLPLREVCIKGQVAKDMLTDTFAQWFVYLGKFAKSSG